MVDYLLEMPIDDTNPNQGNQIHHRLRNLGTVWNSPFPAVGHITSSFGVAQREPSDTIRELTERADKALYAAKTGERNRVAVQA